MKISETTLAILENFSTVNRNIIIEPGSKLVTVSADREIQAVSVVDEKFPVKVVLYNLKEFLNVLSMFKEPNLQFDDDFIAIESQSGRTQAKYYYADERTLDFKLIQSVRFNKPEISFHVKDQDFVFASKSVSTLFAGSVSDATKPAFSISSDGSDIRLSVIDLEGTVKNESSISLEQGGAGKEWTVIFNRNKVKVLKGNYDVLVADNGVSKWANTELELTYTILADEEGFKYAEAAS